MWRVYLIGPNVPLAGNVLQEDKIQEEPQNIKLYISTLSKVRYEARFWKEMFKSCVKVYFGWKWNPFRKSSTKLLTLFLFTVKLLRCFFKELKLQQVNYKGGENGKNRKGEKIKVGKVFYFLHYWWMVVKVRHSGEQGLFVKTVTLIISLSQLISDMLTSIFVFEFQKRHYLCK